MVALENFRSVEELLGEVTDPQELFALLASDELEWQLSPLAMAAKWEDKPQGYKGTHEPRHLQLISDLIVAMYHNEVNNRVIVTLPPGHAKSSTLSRWTPTWIMEQNPKSRILFGAYNSNFAGTFGANVRDTIIALQDYLTVRVDPRRSAAGRWYTLDGGFMMSRGVGAGFTGNRADWFIIDDPIKDPKEADSQAFRDGLERWYERAALTRMEPQGKIIIVMTRWHEDDLVGRIEKRMRDGGSPYTIIKIPALSNGPDVDPLGREEGEAIWPERFSTENLRAIRADMSDAGWSALYQQEPMPEGGIIVQPEWLDENRYDPTRPPTPIARYMSVDASQHDKESGAFSVVLIADLLEDYRVAIKQVHREHLAFPDLSDLIETYMFANLPTMPGVRPLLRRVYVEDEALGSAIIQGFRRSLPPQLRRYMTGVDPQGSKAERMRAQSHWIRNGMVLFPHPHKSLVDHWGNNWHYDYEYELTHFPGTIYSDQVDATSQLLKKLEAQLYKGWVFRQQMLERGMGGRL